MEDGVACLMPHGVVGGCRHRSLSAFAATPTRQVQQRGPCVHNVAHAMQAGVNAETLFHPRYTVARWAAQYRARFPIVDARELRKSVVPLRMIPTIALVEGENARRGRKRGKRMKGAFELAAKKSKRS